MRFRLGPVPSNPDFQPDESWVRLKEFSPGMMQVASFPVGVAVALFIATVWCVYTPLGDLDLSLTTIGLLFVFNIVAHEWIHALAEPHMGRSPDTVVGFWPAKGVFYAHYHGPLNRNQLIVILLAPFMVLSVLPLVLAMVLQVSCAWAALLSVINALSSCADLYATGMTLAQIPAGATVRNQGWDTYLKPRDGFVPPAGIWARYHKIILSLVLPALLIAAIYAEEDFRDWHAWQQVKQAGEARGERYDYASIVPPAVPDDRNFAMDPVVATSYLTYLDQHGHVLKPANTNVVNRLNMALYNEYDDNSRRPTNGSWARGTVTDLKEWQAYYRTSWTNEHGILTNNFPTSPQPQSPAADVLLALGKYDATFEALRSASRLACSRFPLNYDPDHPLDVRLPHLSPLKNCVQVLQIRALAELELGQSQGAFADVQLGLRLAEAIHGEPSLIAQNIRLAQIRIIVQVIYEGLARHQWSDAELAALQSELAGLDFAGDYLFAMRAERNCALARIEFFRLRRSFREYAGWQPEENGGRFERSLDRLGYWVADGVVYSLPNGWFYLAQAGVENWHQQWMVKAVDVHQDRFFPEVTKGAADWRLTPAAILSGFWSSYRGTPALKFAYAQSAVDMARVGCALERYRLAHQSYPQTLDALAPQYLERVPNDVIGGKPLKYRRETEGGGFILYSIGWNGVDDDGKAGLSPYEYQNIRTGDWVWRYPTNYRLRPGGGEGLL